MTKPFLPLLQAALVLSLVGCANATEPAKGDPGEMGEMGEMGTMGVPGAAGPTGTQGISCWDLNSNSECDAATEDYNEDSLCNVEDCFGVEGPTGATGAPGPQGPTGPMGAQGLQGPQGAQGPQGPQGLPGMAGPAGATGPMGLMGPAGTPGSAGPTGPTGPAGAPGAQGAQGPAGAAGPAGTTGQVGAGAFGTASATITPAAGFTLLPGLSTTISVPASSFVQITTDGGFGTTATTNTGFSRIDVALFIDNVIVPNGGYRRVVASNTDAITTGNLSTWSMSIVTTLGPGTHTIAVAAAGTGGGSDAVVSGDNNSAFQGSLGAIVLKQ